MPSRWKFGWAGTASIVGVGTFVLILLLSGRWDQAAPAAIDSLSRPPADQSTQIAKLQAQVDYLTEAVAREKLHPRSTPLFTGGVKFVATTCNDSSATLAPHATKKASVTTESGQTFSMKVHARPDIVSSHILQNGVWEISETARVLQILGQRDGLLLDIGANIGWFTLRAAFAGHNVIAFEPFITNSRMLRESMCMNSGLERNIKLYAMGLGHKQQNCEFWQNDNENTGDTQAICDDTPENLKCAFRARGFIKLGDAPVSTLDAALDQNVFRRKVDLMKMDVEGYEPNVLAGGEKFFASEFAPDHIIMEASETLLSDALGNGAEQLRNEFQLLLRYGYKTGGMDTKEKIDQLFKGHQGNPEFSRSKLRRLSYKETSAKDDEHGRRRDLKGFLSRVDHIPTKREMFLVASRIES